MNIKKATLGDLLALHADGKLVGVFETSAEDYHNAPGLSNTSLGDVAQAPAVYDYNRKNPIDETESLLFGRVLHKLILEPETFFESFAVAPEDCDRRGTKKWNEFVLANPGKVVIKANDGASSFAIAKQIADVARAHSKSPLLEGYRELSFFWKDPRTGILCKCRPDVLTLKGVIVDYKSAQTVYPSRVWSSHLFAYRYHVQAAFNLDGIVHALEQSGAGLADFPLPKAFVHYAQEKTAPFLVKAWKVGDATISLGRREYEKNLQTIKECEAKGEYPGYPETIEEIEAPEYAWKDEMSDEE